MIGTVDHERMRSTTSEPSMSGRPRSTMARSMGRNVAERMASAPVEASCTTKPFNSKPVRKKRRICTSSSTTSTIGDGSFICATFNVLNRGLSHRQFDGHRGAQVGALAGGVHGTTIGQNKGIGDPKPQAEAAGGGGVALAACEAPPHLRLLVGGQTGSLVAYAQRHAAVMGLRADDDLRAGRRIFCRI